MSTLPTLYLHIGLPKTGTTFLQNEVFPHLTHLHYRAKPKSGVLTGGADPRYGVLDRCFKHSSHVWSTVGDDVLADVLPAGFEKGQLPGSVLISDEGLGTGGRKPSFFKLHLEAFSDRVSCWGFSAVKVICSFRRQDQWLASHYAQISDRVEGASQASFEAYVNDFVDRQGSYFTMGIMLDFVTLREQLVSVSGKDGVLMLPYETLREDPVRYLTRVLEFVGADPAEAGELSRRARDRSSEQRRNARSVIENRWAIRRRRGDRDSDSVPARVLERLGLPRRLPLRRPTRRRGRQIRMTTDLRRMILDCYAEQNRQLASELDTKLDAYGYY